MKDRHRHHEVKEKVKYLLETKPQTRESYDVLYVEIIRLINPDAVYKPFYSVLTNTFYPSYQSVARASRALKREFPDLRETEENQKARQDIEAEYELHYGRTGF